MAKTTEGPYFEGVNDANAGRELHNQYGDTDDGWAYIRGYESVKPRTVANMDPSRLTQISDPGARDNGDGSFTIQLAPRSGQLEKIAEDIREYLSGSGKITAHLLDRNAEQLLIISDELKRAGK